MNLKKHTTPFTEAFRTPFFIHEYSNKRLSLCKLKTTLTTKIKVPRFNIPHLITVFTVFR